MPLFAETEEKIFGDILFDVVSTTNISRTSPGSKARISSHALYMSATEISQNCRAHSKRSCSGFNVRPLVRLNNMVKYGEPGSGVITWAFTTSTP